MWYGGLSEVTVVGGEGSEGLYIRGDAFEGDDAAGRGVRG